MREPRQKFQTFMLLVAVSAIATYYLLDLVALAQATLVVVRDLKAQSEATASKLASLVQSEEGE